MAGRIRGLQRYSRGTHGCTDQPCDVKILLANSEPSTHGTSRKSRSGAIMSAFAAQADVLNAASGGPQLTRSCLRRRCQERTFVIASVRAFCDALPHFFGLAA